MFLKIFWMASIISLVLLSLPEIRYIFFNIIGRWLYIFLLSFSLAIFFTPIMTVIARNLGIMDFPDARKIHSDATPLLGGVAIIIAFTISILANAIMEREIVITLWAALFLSIFSIVDDWRGLSAKVKLLAQMGAVMFLIYNDIVLHLFPLEPWWGYTVNVALTFLWIIGITNAMNFLDGMDGLSTGVSAIIAFFLALVSFQTKQHILGWIAIAILGSCLGFLPYNFRPHKPAAIFLGDTGSIFLGFILSSLAIIGDWSDNSPIVSFAAPVLIFWVLIFDMTYITAERIATGKVKTIRQWLDYVGQDHLHHRTYVLLGDRRKAVLFIYLLSATLGVSAIVLLYARSVDAVLLVIQAFLITVIISILDYSGRHR